MDIQTLRTQLAPQWSGVNIAIIVVLYLISLPLALIMIAYVVWGRKLDLNLARPQSFVTAGTRLSKAMSRALSDLSGSESGSGATGNGGTPSGVGGEPSGGPFDDWRKQETERLRVEREALEHERTAFEREKAAYEAGRRSTSDS